MIAPVMAEAWPAKESSEASEAWLVSCPTRLSSSWRWRAQIALIEKNTNWELHRLRIAQIEKNTNWESHRLRKTLIEKHVLSHRGKWHDNRPIFTNAAQFELFWSPDMRSSCCYQVFTVRSFSMVRKWFLYRECESPYDGRGLACLIPQATSFSSGNLRCS